MHRFAFILSLFILVLSLVPCSDNACDPEEQNLELSSGQSDHDHEEDTCTPLCSCSCCGCGGFVLSSPVFDVAFQEVKTPSSSTPGYHSDFTSSYFYSFWQPPKLS